MARHGLRAIQFGLAKESVRGTAETTPTKWYPVLPTPEPEYKLMHMEDDGLRGVRANFAPIAGRKIGTGKLKMILDPQTVGELMLSLMGSVTSAEDSTITIGATNNMLDFNIGAGELTATVASAAYPIGTAHTQAGTLCKAIYDAIVSAEAVGTYTVAYSRTTKKFTITRSAGTFSILWNTGTNKATGINTTIGYAIAADDTAALTYTGDNQIEYSFLHSYTLGTGYQPQSYTFFIDFGISVKKYNRACVKSLTFNGPVDGLIEMDVDFLFESEAAGAIGTPAYPTQRYLSFKHVTYNIAAAESNDVKSWTLKIDNAAKAEMAMAQSQDIQDIIVVDPIKVTGSMVILFSAETERAKYLANTAVALQMLIESDAIVSTFKWGVNLPVTAAHYKSYPFGHEDGILAAKTDFEGYHNGTSIVLPAVRNQEASY